LLLQQLELLLQQELQFQQLVLFNSNFSNSFQLQQLSSSATNFFNSSSSVSSCELLQLQQQQQHVFH
jgi:hypothetical protein